MPKIAANGKKDGFVLDMSTSSVAVGKIEMQLRKGQDLPSKGIVTLIVEFSNEDVKSNNFLL